MDETSTSASIGHDADAEGQRHILLTPREREVLRLLATPSSTAEMAALLVLSQKTVRNHVAAVYRKLGVHSRAEAIVKGVELDLVEREG